jgi:hypothetical protein
VRFCTSLSLHPFTEPQRASLNLSPNPATTS